MIVDYFPFFNERELLELRIKLLEPHVDHFVICEADKTFTGIPKPMILPELIDQLKLPQDRITVVQLTVPPDREMPMEEHDFTSQFPEDWGNLDSIKANARDRAQRNGLMKVIDQFDDQDLIIISDCDEIINPAHLNFAVHMARSMPNNIIKLPLINLYGRADLRPYYANGQPLSWRTAMSICHKSIIAQTTPHRIRCDYELPVKCINPTLNGEIFENFGWHFSWMGGTKRVAEKSRSYAHAPNVGHQEHAKKGFRFEEGQSLTWDPNTVMRRFTLEQLPSLLFDLPRVKAVLLPD
jgi:hypothetical protein